MRRYIHGDPRCVYNNGEDCWVDEVDPEYACYGIEFCSQGKKIEVKELPGERSCWEKDIRKVEDVSKSNEKQLKATHRISACYYPQKNECEFSWENLETGEACFLLVGNVTEEFGDRIAEVVPCCIYHYATFKSLEDNGTCKVQKKNEVVRNVV